MATACVINVSNGKSSVINTSNGSSSVIDCDNRLSDVIYKIPFKIKITNITVPGYGPFNPPPIGIAIIGLNNYIL